MSALDSDITVIEQILRLRRAERLAEPEVRAEIVPVRDFLEASLGPTISRAMAARMLGISQPALNRWIDRGDIPAVLTPQGRREVPLSELLPLIEEVRQAREEQGGRALTRVLRQRMQAAREAIDLDQLLPKRKPRTHRVAELQSLAYHRLVAQRLDDQILDAARVRLLRWHDEGRIHPEWADEWERILSLPVSRIRQVISADSVSARELRQSSPFAGVLPEQESRILQRAVEARVRG